MSKKDLTFEDVLSRINNNFNIAKSTREVNNASNDYHQLQLQLTTEIEQVNRRWDVDPEFKITSHRGSIGKIIVSGKKVIRKILRWYINPLFTKQKNYNASVTRALNIMKENSNHTKNILDELSRDKALLADKFDNLNEQIKQLINDKKQLTMENATLVQSIKELTEQQNRKNLGLTQNIEDFTKKLSLAFDHIGALKEQLSIEHNYQQEVKNVIDEKFESINELISFVKRKVKKIDSGAKIFKEKNKVNESSIEINAPIDQEVKYEMDYVLFENKFRGSRNTIKERQKQYLQYILPTDRVLDIGCGRGEFIELLTESGVTVEGIDLNEDMVEYCQDRGFNVKYADAIEYLINASPQSYDCISMCQVIEHLTFEQYTYLLSLILNALKPGGRVIIETINAQSVYAMSNWFYIDPTHTKPVHPETLDFVIKETGFNKTERKNVSPVEHINVPQINNIENSEEINRAIGDLYGMLYGYQDYAIIAWR